MAVGRPILGLFSLLFLAGAILLTFFVLLAGATHGSPVDMIYFLEADVSSIVGSVDTVARWTYWNYETVDANGNVNWASVAPAYPFDPQNNFGTQNDVPAQFVGTNTFYYQSRVMFAFMLVELFFTVIAFFTGMLALCSRLVSFASSGTVAFALICGIIQASLMTSVFVMGRNDFQSAGIAADIGRYAFGFTWATVACLFIAMVLLCAGGASSGSGEARSSRFGRRGKRDRGSFIDTEDQRHVDATA